MEMKSSRKIKNYQIQYHLSTMIYGHKAILGLDNKLSIVDLKNKVCIGEFEVDGRVENMTISRDLNEIILYTNKCKLYRF